ncbi:MAG: YkgJ family cysteine cluster protein [Fibrobacteria bacterium]
MPESADQQGRGALGGAGSPLPQTLQIDLQTRFGRVQGNLAVPPGAIRLAELAWNSMAIDERLIGMAVAAEARQGRQVSCKKGCGACCYQAVPLSPAEAWMIADVVASLPADRKAATLERFAAAKARLSEAGFGERSLQGAGEAEVMKLGIDYFRLRIPCPFLVDDACSIHPNRPSACREFLVSSPAENCADPVAREIRSIPTAAILTEALSKVSALVMGGEPFAIPLPLALEWAVENREAGGKRFDATLLLTALVEFLASSRTGTAGQGAA